MSRAALIAAARAVSTVGYFWCRRMILLHAYRAPLMLPLSLRLDELQALMAEEDSTRSLDL